ncbi:hypothetical protein VFPBJ_09722 [Purpureocillium lilacinum]|uniref:Uncharacterized protein n=1 Tax=Purpureocillium lilacinum TaxID=33203 RepID=A0A179G9D3_PURLI|nr:hypothetical protein VFPBJ_09722 [Purpureocillium lilacinum]
MCDNCRARGLRCVFELAGDIRPSIAEKNAINRRNALLGASHPAVRMIREMALAREEQMLSATCSRTTCHSRGQEME